MVYNVRVATQRLAEALESCVLLESGSNARPVSMCGRILVPSLIPLWMNQISVTYACVPAGTRDRLRSVDMSAVFVLAQKLNIGHTHN